MTPAQLIALRERLGLTQFQMAIKLDLSLSQYGRYEHGTSPISRQTVALVRAYWPEMA